jgi:xanthosine utilization system XapX-like protein
MGASQDDTKAGQVRTTSPQGAPGPPGNAGATEGFPETASPAAVVLRLLALRIPVWLALAVVGLVGVFVAGLLLVRDPVDLGPAVDGATEASISLTVCNETVDRRHINPRTAELDLEEGLEELGVQQAEAMLTRIDCGPDDRQD